jgi:SseB protein N-terminal domain
MEVWEKKGCDVCRRKWLAGERLTKLAVSVERHASLHYCEQCKTYWEQYERHVDVIDEVEGSKIYGQDTVSKHTELQSRFDPQNPLEISLVESQRGRIPFKKFLEQLLTSDVFVLSKETASLSSFAPIQFERNGELYVATFTSLERTRRLAEQFTHCLSISASELLTRISPSLGIVLNPGWEVGFELTASGLGGIRRDFQL